MKASWALLLALFFLAGCGPDLSASEQEPVASEGEEAELATHMSNLQRWSHKLLLGAQAENKEVSEFYLHELEEQVEEIAAEVPEYEGHPIADLTETILVPHIDSLHAAMEEEDWSAIYERLETTIQACNQCHEATDHGFIQITADPGSNPYNQRFVVP